MIERKQPDLPGILGILLAIGLLATSLLIVSTAHTQSEPDKDRKTELPSSTWTVPSPEMGAMKPIVRHAVKYDRSPPLASIPPRPLWGGRPPLESEPLDVPLLRLPRQAKEGEGKTPSGIVDPVVQSWHGDSPMPVPIQNFDGLDNADNQKVAGLHLVPPDTQGDVGPNHYVQWVNLVFAIWDKSGKLLYGPTAGNALWAGFGGPCEDTNHGDPITLYDPMADRWLMSQFALPNDPYGGPYYQCIAVSTSGDPIGSWNRYAYEWENGSGQDVVNDYPKFGVWPDGYYMTANQFGTGNSWAGTGAAAFERAEMLKGQPARMVYFDLGPSDWGGMLPADLDGFSPPPLGSPNYFVQANADEWAWGLNDELRVYEFRVDWSNLSNSTFQQMAMLPTDPFDGGLCGLSPSCIPQPGSSPKLDAIADRLMYRLQYRNFGSYESLVTNLTVDADGNDHAGVRWFELRKHDGAWSIHQQGTYAPDGDHRWMGSIAMDKVGNIALGYSVASQSTFPSIRYAGRLVTDPLGTLAQREVQLVAGLASQVESQGKGYRWGDYSTMAVDPVDDCTFWYTQEYVASPGEWGNWSTRIGSFRFPDCLGPTGTLQGTVTEDDTTGRPIAGAKVTASADRSYVCYTQPVDGSYRFEAVPSGIYTVTAAAYAYQPQTFAGVHVPSASTTSQDFRLSPAASYVLSGTVVDGATGWPLYASIEIDGYPGEIIWTDPATGFYSVSLAADTPYTLAVKTWVAGYHAAYRSVGALTEQRTESFEMSVDTTACSAPGYELQITGVFESFENGGLVPARWTVVDIGDSGQVWAFDNPGGRENETGGSGGFAVVDSDFYGADGAQDTELRTPRMNFSGLVSVWLMFDTDYRAYTDEIADVEVSVDGGATWTNVWQVTGSSHRRSHEMVDISPLAAGQADVVIRFHYHNASWDWWWQVDNVLVGQNLGCQPRAGSLVLGNVYDDNTGAPLVGAKVTSDVGELTTAAATPIDPGVDDALYILFLPTGSHILTATLGSRYSPQVASVTVVETETVLRDFHLPAGWLTYEPEGVDISMQMDISATVPFTIFNEGGQPLEFEITEMKIGSQPLGSPRFIEVNIPGAEITYGPDARLAKRRASFRPDLSFVVEQLPRPGDSIRVLLLTPDAAAGGDVSLIQNTLEAFPDLSVTLWNSAPGALTGADLVPYDVVIVGNDYLWIASGVTPEAVGDALADYIDAGGKVIDTLFVHDYDDWQLAGRYISEGYAPFTAGTANKTALPYSLGTVYDPAHPIMDGITSITDTPAIGISHQNVGMAPRATRLADWNSGEVYVAHNDNVVGVNQVWFHGANWTGDVPKLMHNAILFLVGGDAEWLSIVPIKGEISPASSLIVSVTMDAGDSSVAALGRYYAKLYLENNTPYGNPAVPVTMTVEASAVCTRVVSVEWALVNTDTIQPGTLANFAAELTPVDAPGPYNYTIDYGDGTAGINGSANSSPLTSQYVYPHPAIYTPKIAVWNCDMTETVAVTDTLLVNVSAVAHYIYLPILIKHD